MEKEDFLHFIWKNSYYSYSGLRLTTGETIEVIDPGSHNLNSGPDFFNAKLKTGETVWAGNVEIHLNSSDWYKHGHNFDPSYDSVILHLVVNNDKPAVNSKKREIATLVIPYPDLLEWNYLRLLGSGKWIPCAENISVIDQFSWHMWLTSLMIERLEEKSQLILDQVNHAKGSWEEVFYQSIARSFGLLVNALPFELLAKSTPLKVLAKQKNNLIQIEAILFGQAGMLNKNLEGDDYLNTLKCEYLFLKEKYNLTPIDGSLWKFMRMRPMAFPTIRIALFAGLIHQSSSMFSRMVKTGSMKSISSFLDLKASDYWDNHYTFEKESELKIKRLGKDMAQTITVNSVVPFMFAYGQSCDEQQLKDLALKLLENQKPEENGITRGFRKLGVDVASAFDTQALVQLKNGYCKQKKCLYCHLGATLLMKSGII